MGGACMNEAIKTEDVKVGDVFFVLPRGDLLSAMKRVRKLEITSITFCGEKPRDVFCKQPNEPLLKYEISAKELISPVKLCEKEIKYAAYKGHIFIPNGIDVQSTPVNKTSIRFLSYGDMKVYITCQAFSLVNEFKEKVRQAEQDLFEMKLAVNEYTSECKEVIGSMELMKKGLME